MAGRIHNASAESIARLKAHRQLGIRVANAVSVGISEGLVPACFDLDTMFDVRAPALRVKSPSPEELDLSCAAPAVASQQSWDFGSRILDRDDLEMIDRSPGLCVDDAARNVQRRSDGPRLLAPVGRDRHFGIRIALLPEAESHRVVRCRIPFEPAVFVGA